ncbi:MAG: hypothetical protein B7Z80_15005 [Rhodospirillales bacterium 20-64-7]|nr:MAG: hypothetical protein B7Z80_15005 [Rhodospirillales bacterium 20-64-7]
MKPECSRPIMLDRIGPGGLDITVDATPAECGALALRMGLPAVHAMSCTFHLERESRDIVSARGHLRARVTQTCVVTLEDFEASIEEHFQVRFVPEGRESEELNLDADDEIPFAGNQVDIGEAASEQLGLALDPYPRLPGAELPEPEEEPEENPFAALRRLN